MKSFTYSELRYCLVVWMNHGRKLKYLINKSHQRALMVVYNDKDTTFDELLNSVKIYLRNLQVLVTVMRKTKLGIALVIVNNIFQIRESNVLNKILMNLNPPA